MDNANPTMEASFESVCGSVFGDTIQDGIDAYEREDKQTAKKILTPLTCPS